MSDTTGHLALARELQMTLLSSSEMLLTSHSEYGLSLQVCCYTPFGLSTCASHIAHSTLTGICCDIKRLKMLPANQDLPGLAALPGLPQAINHVERNHEHLPTCTMIKGCLAPLLGRESQSIDLVSTCTTCTQAVCKSPVFSAALTSIRNYQLVFILHIHYLQTATRGDLGRKHRKAVQGFPAWKGGFQLCKPHHK